MMKVVEPGTRDDRRGRRGFCLALAVDSVCPYRANRESGRRGGNSHNQECAKQRWFIQRDDNREGRFVLLDHISDIAQRQGDLLRSPLADMDKPTCVKKQQYPVHPALPCFVLRRSKCRVKARHAPFCAADEYEQGEYATELAQSPGEADLGPM